MKENILEEYTSVVANKLKPGDTVRVIAPISKGLLQEGEVFLKKKSLLKEE